MLSYRDAGEVAQSMPEVTEGVRFGNRTWYVRGKAFMWERPFSKADIKRFGAQAPPPGEILAVAVADLGEKGAVISMWPKAFFTIPHFDGFAAVLVQMEKVTKKQLREAIVDAWLACAPPAVRDGYLAGEHGLKGARHR